MAENDNQIIERLTRIETTLQEYMEWNREIVKEQKEMMKDLEIRVRGTEQNREECRQDIRIEKIETRLCDGEKRFDELDKCLTSHISCSEGTEKAHVNIRELALFAVAAGELAIIFIQFMLGK